MNANCTRLHLFIDGELGDAEAEAFRSHLPRCPACEEGLKDLLQLEMLAARALGGAALEAEAAAPAPSPSPQKPETKVVPLRPWARRAYQAAIPLAMAACLSAIFVYRQAPSDVPGVVFLEDMGTRGLEERLSHPRADHWRPYGPMRGSESTVEALPLRPLADLEEREDLRGVAAAYLLRGDLRQAEAFLEREKPSADRDNDLAVVALKQRSLTQALELLNRALRAEPRHPQALWNRGLVLRELDLLDRAADSFEQVAQLGEQGWSQEARQEAERLRALHGKASK
ncbi:tetratricopeptide repeat protein [Myxococcaceae bacterium JPH2]|nr:tetratricopeptide repeat protein [Myxococcaceae bacterium JPH2]